MSTHGIINPLIRWLVEGVEPQSRGTCPSCPERRPGMGRLETLASPTGCPPPLISAHLTSPEGILRTGSPGQGSAWTVTFGEERARERGGAPASAPLHARPGWWEHLQPHTWTGEQQGRPLSGQLPRAFWNGQQMPQAQRRCEDPGEGTAAGPAAAECSGHGPVIGQPVPR